MNNLFFPVYQKLEQEFIDLSFFIFINEEQLKTYSIRIADLLLRTVSECENIASQLCKKEKVEFKQKNGKPKSIVNFSEYIEALDKIYNLKQKYVSFDYANCSKDAFDSKLSPFDKSEMEINKKKIINWSWYFAYNKIKHDRINYFNLANVENLINALSALFLLNNYNQDKIYYSIDGANRNDLIKEINSLSKLFTLDIIPDVKTPEGIDIGFPNPYLIAKLAKPHSTYLMKIDEFIETDSDKGQNVVDELRSMAYYKNEEGLFQKSNPNMVIDKKRTKCSLVIKLNKEQ